MWDHSNVAADMVGRLRRTARFVAVTTFAERDTADKAIARVRSIHEQVQGALPDGRRYRADEPALLASIHVAGVLCFLDDWIHYGEPGMSAADQDRCFAEVAIVARALGADARTVAFRKLVLDAPAPSLAEAHVQGLLMAAAVDLMPDWARSMHGLNPTLPLDTTELS